MGQREKMIKQIKKQRKMVLNELENALEDAQKMLYNKGLGGNSPSAVVQLAEFIFQINMGAKQKIAQIPQILAMQKMQENMRNKGKTSEKSPCGCGDCQACRR